MKISFSMYHGILLFILIQSYKEQKDLLYDIVLPLRRETTLTFRMRSNLPSPKAIRLTLGNVAMQEL